MPPRTRPPPDTSSPPPTARARRGTAPAAAATEPPHSPWTGQQERSEQARSAKREMVVRAAARCFAERGVQGTSMDDLAAALSVTKPTIYRAVGDKDAVIDACAQRMAECFLGAMREAEAAGGTGLRKVSHYLRRSLHLMKNDEFGRLAMVLSTNGDIFAGQSVAARSMRQQIQVAVRAWIEDDRRAGLVRQGTDARTAALALFGVFNFLPRWFRPAGPDSLDEVFESHWRILVWALTDRPQAHGFDL